MKTTVVKGVLTSYELMLAILFRWRVRSCGHDWDYHKMQTKDSIDQTNLHVPSHPSNSAIKSSNNKSCVGVVRAKEGGARCTIKGKEAHPEEQVVSLHDTEWMRVTLALLGTGLRSYLIRVIKRWWQHRQWEREAGRPFGSTHSDFYLDCRMLRRTGFVQVKTTHLT
jgi:hypothetical protein